MADLGTKVSRAFVGCFLIALPMLGIWSASTLHCCSLCIFLSGLAHFTLAEFYSLASRSLQIFLLKMSLNRDPFLRCWNSQELALFIFVIAVLFSSSRGWKTTEILTRDSNHAQKQILQRALSMTEYVCSCHFHAQGQQTAVHSQSFYSSCHLRLPASHATKLAACKAFWNY